MKLVEANYYQKVENSSLILNSATLRIFGVGSGRYLLKSVSQLRTAHEGAREDKIFLIEYGVLNFLDKKSHDDLPIDPAGPAQKITNFRIFGMLVNRNR